MNVNQEVRLNLSVEGIPPRLSMPQGDANSRTIVATLWDGATPYSVPSNAAVLVRFRKPDGTGGLYDATEAGAAVTASGNTVTAPVATQMLAVAGVVQAEIDIYGTGLGKAADRLATFRFAVEVAPSVYPDAQIISSDYFNLIAATISEVIEAAAKADLAKTAAQAAQSAAETAQSGAESAEQGAQAAQQGAQTAQAAAENAKTAAQTAQHGAEAAQAAAEDAQAAAENAKTAAQAAQQGAQTAQAAAENSKTAAQTAQQGAKTAQAAAENAKTAAQTAQHGAEAAQAAAEGAKSGAQAAQQGAQEAQAAAENAKTAAQTAQQGAKAAQQGAQTAQHGAEAAQAAAEGAKSGAQAAQQGAQTAQNGAEAAQAAAEDAQAAAASSAAAAAASAANAATSVEGAVKYNTPQTLTDSQKQQARENINAPAPYEAGDNISITGRIITTKAFPCNPNLLDNWYFGNPVDQRNGYLVHNGANLYTDATCTTVAGTVSGGPYQAYPISSICVSFTTNATYYCKIGDAGVVRGYTGALYTIDRWKLFVSGSVAITDGGLQFSSAVNFGQVLEGRRVPNGIKATASVLTNAGLAAVTFSLSGEAQQTFSAIVGGTSLYFTGNWSSSGAHLIMLDGSELVKAVKLEIGSQQTLAHQENGKWVLNEIPDYGEQLRRCQRYYQRLKASSGYMRFGISQPYTDTTAGVFIPLQVEMRTASTMSSSGNFALFEGSTLHGVNLSLDTASPYNVILTATGTGLPGTSAQLLANADTSAYIELSADL